MSDLNDVITVIVNKGDIKWYSMVNCEVGDGDVTGELYLPAAFLKQSGLLKSDSIDDEDFMLDYNDANLKNVCPHLESAMRRGLNSVKKYWNEFLPKHYQTDEVYKDIYYIMRVASCACVLSGKEEIEGLRSLYENVPEAWGDYSHSLHLIEEALHGEGKIIGPLDGRSYFTGWKIISMIYTMVWCNSQIRNNRDELIFLIRMMLSVDKLKFDKTANHVEIVDAIKNKLEAQKLSSNAWIILFLYIRNYQWFHEYMFDLIQIIDISQYHRDTWEKLYEITEPWSKQFIYLEERKKVVKIDDVKKAFQNEVTKLKTNQFRLFADILFGKDMSKKNKSDVKNMIFPRLSHVINIMRFARERMAYSYIVFSHCKIVKYNLLNLFFWICVEFIIYHNFINSELPSCNKLDFIRQRGLMPTFSRGKGVTSALKLKKGLDNAEARHEEGDFYNFSSYEQVYMRLTEPIRLAILIGKGTDRFFNDEKSKYKRYKEGLYQIMRSMH